MNSEAAAFLIDLKAEIIESEASVPVVERRGSKAPSVRIAGIPSIAMERSDEELIRRIHVGDREALALLFRRNAKRVFNVANRILRDDAEAEDLLQEMFLFVYQKASHFDASKASALSWLIQMTYHRAIDRRRYLNTRQHYVTEEFQDDLQRPNHAQQSIDDIAGRELLDKFRNELTTEQQQTLELHFFEGYTFHEIAEKTGQTLGNVRHHYYRGLERLRSFVFLKKRD